MSRTPTYDGPQLREAALPTPFMDPGMAMGRARQTRALAEVAGMGAEILERQQERDDNEAAFKFETRVVADWMEADSALRQRHRGSSVDGYREAVDDWWSKAPSKYGQGLTPGAQRIAARALAAKRLQALSSSSTYFNSEKERATVAAAEAKKQTTIQLAMVDGRPEALATARKDILETNAREAARRGQTAEEMAAENLRDLTTLHGNALVALMDRDVKEAKAYFEANKSEIDASRHGGIERALKTAGVLETVQVEADKIMALGLPLDEAMKRVEKGFSGEEEAKLKGELQSRYAYEEATKTKRQQEAFGRASLELEQTGRVSRSTMATLTDGQQAQVLAAMRARAKQAAAEAAGKEIKTDIDAYQKVREAIMAGERVMLGQFVDKISRSDLKQLADLQTQRADPKAARRLFSEERFIDNYASLLKLDKGTDDWNQWRQVAEDAIIQLHEEKGQQLTDADIRERLDRLITEGTVQRDWIWDPTKRLYELTPEELQRFTAATPEGKVAAEVHAIPAQERVKIVDALRRAGQPINDRSVWLLYTAKQQGGR